MTADRKRRKKNKKRGQRTMGAGNTKNRRGAGGRGGRGKAGTNKHRFHSAGRLKPRRYKLKIIAKKGKEINLIDLDARLDEMVAAGKVKKEGEKYIVDKTSGLAKVLSEGEVTHKIVLKINASKKAIAKIIKAGGKFEFAKEGYDSKEVIAGEEDEDLEFESVEGEVEEK
jgi:large subunit ribosomal protein L15